MTSHRPRRSRALRSVSSAINFSAETARRSAKRARSTGCASAETPASDFACAPNASDASAAPSSHRLTEELLRLGGGLESLGQEVLHQISVTARGNQRVCGVQALDCRPDQTVCLLDHARVDIHPPVRALPDHVVDSARCRASICGPGGRHDDCRTSLLTWKIWIAASDNSPDLRLACTLFEPPACPPRATQSILRFRARMRLPLVVRRSPAGLIHPSPINVPCPKRTGYRTLAYVAAARIRQVNKPAPPETVRTT
ncbi:hypothetical protein EV652_12264 [Kribbella steppae]|uniref:Uncharacterized protein n=1 Tax=Kribbella steppae TaxID=2512223 RepID=A0A4R2GWZ0_9ACTN|nr:hypothetical protein EV652_12264 [Kribbella steppae]